MKKVYWNLKKSDFNNLDKVCLVELDIADFEAMKELHDKTFPNTYYSGEEIISRLNDYRKVFVCKEADELAGYMMNKVHKKA